MRTLLVDGTNLFIRSYTVDSTLDANGNPSGGISGTLKALRLIIKSLKPRKVIFVWDGPGGSSTKRKVFKEYKEGRKPIAGRHYQFEDENRAKENKIWQMTELRKLIDCLPVCQIITENIEADDVIGYVVTNKDFFGSDSCIIATCDKDFYQLIGSKVCIYNPIKKCLVTEKSLLEDTGYDPVNWLFYKAINGDKSDNIDGVKGFGEKTIAKLFDVGVAVPLTIEDIEEAYNQQKDYFESCQSVGYTKAELKRAETPLKRYRTLKENIPIIERNWKLMSLKDPMISISHKDKLTEKILNFVPTLNKPKFYVSLMELGGLGIPANYFDEYHTLRAIHK